MTLNYSNYSYKVALNSHLYAINIEIEGTTAVVKIPPYVSREIDFTNCLESNTTILNKVINKELNKIESKRKQEEIKTMKTIKNMMEAQQVEVDKAIKAIDLESAKNKQIQAQLKEVKEAIKALGGGFFAKDTDTQEVQELRLQQKELFKALNKSNEKRHTFNIARDYMQSNLDRLTQQYLITTLLEVVEVEFKGKQYGPKTNERLSDRIKELTDYRAYLSACKWSDRYSEIHFINGHYKDIEITLKGSILNDNNRITLEGVSCDIETVKTVVKSREAMKHAKDLKALESRIRALEGDMNDLIETYNKQAPDTYQNTNNRVNKIHVQFL